MIRPAEENTERRVLVLVLVLEMGKLAVLCRRRCVSLGRSTYSARCSVPWPKFAGGEQERHWRKAFCWMMLRGVA